MKKLLLLFLCVPLIAFTQDKSKIIEVYNANQFVDAIGPNRTINLMGTINLSEIDTNKFGDYYRIQNAYDGPELVIHHIEYLNIVGVDEYPIEILTKPRYGWVLVFEDCKNIMIDNVNAGHFPDKGGCTGGVFYFKDCRNILINNSIMYGSGTEGIRTEKVKNLQCNNSIIWGCTYYIMTLNNSMYIEFNNCKFNNNEEFDLINISTCINVEFNSCEFMNNKNGSTRINTRTKQEYGGCYESYTNDALFDVNESISVVLNNCSIKNNNTCYFLRTENTLELNNTVFENNKFNKGLYQD